MAGMVAPATTAEPMNWAELYAKLTVAAVVFFVALEVAYFAVVGLPPIYEPAVDGSGYVLGRDFLNIWMGGRSVLGRGPQAWFDLEIYNAALRVMLGPNFPEHFWSYPPHLLLFTWPFGLMPYLPAYVLWCALGLAFYLLACPASVRQGKLLFLAAAPGVTVCIFFGQDGLFTAALLIGGLVNLDRRPILAGILFGILTVKPQLGLLLPIVLLLTGRWRVIISAVAMALMLAAATAWIFGFGIWNDFLEKVISQQAALLDHDSAGIMFALVSSAYSGARLVGLPEAAWAVQAAFSGFAVLAVIWTFWRRRDPDLSLALLVTATFLATPYVLNYDMVALGFVVALLRDRADNTAADHLLGLAVWTLPATMMLIALGNIPAAPLVLAAFAGRLLWRLSRQAGAQHEETPEASAAEEQPPEAQTPGEEPPETPAPVPTPA